MPFTYSVLTEQNLLYVQCFGALDVRDALRIADKVGGDPRRVDGMQVLVDFGGVTELRVTAKDVLELGALRRGLALRRGGIHQTALCAPCERIFNYAKAFQAAAQSDLAGNLYVSRKLDDALSSLGLASNPDVKKALKALPPLNTH